MRARAILPLTFLSWALLPCFADGDVYFLNDGREIAGHTLSKREGNTIRIETLQGVVSFPSNAVDRILTQKELDRLFNQRESTLDRGKARDIADLAAWCLQNGLYNEMFDLYDQLAVLDPDNLSYKAFINEMTKTIRFKEFDVESFGNDKKGYLLLKKMARSGRTCRVIGENLLAALPEWLRGEVLLKGLRTSDARTQVATLEVAARFTPAVLLEDMIKLAICENNAEVRNAAQNTLLSYKQDEILIPFVRALKSKVKDYRLNALDALALFKDPRTALALIENLQSSTDKRLPPHPDPSVNIATGKNSSSVRGFNGHVSARSGIASHNIEILWEGTSLQVNVLAVSKPVIKNNERVRIAEVLKKITGVDYGDDYLLWNEWWNNNKEKIFDTQKRSSHPPSKPDSR